MAEADEIEEITFRTFLSLCIKKAWKTSWEKSDTATIIAGIVIGIVIHYFPQWEQAVISILWQIPIAALLSIVAMRLLISPFLVYRQRDKEAKLAEIAKDKAETKSRSTPPNVGAQKYGTYPGQEGCGLIVANPGYAARNVHIPTVPLGSTSYELEFPRWMGQLLIHDQNQLFRALIKQPEQTIDGLLLFDLMGKHDIDDIPLAIKFQDAGDKWHQRKIYLKRNEVEGSISVISGQQEPIPTPPSFAG
jgi:hypothetical protein